MGTEGESLQPQLVILDDGDADTAGLQPLEQEFKVYSSGEQVRVYRERTAAEQQLAKEIADVRNQCRELASQLGYNTSDSLTSDALMVRMIGW